MRKTKRKTVLERKKITVKLLQQELKSSPDLKPNLSHFC